MKRKKWTPEEQKLRRNLIQELTQKYFPNSNQLDGGNDKAFTEEFRKRFEEERKKLKQKQES